jgi:tetratricopeptide (TPR) repeat protein
VPKKFYLISLLIACSLSSLPQTVSAQALIPHTLQLNAANLEKLGLSLAQEAAQLAQFQQIDLALPRARMASQLAPKNDKVWLLLGSLDLQTKKFAAATSAFKTAQALNPNNPDVFFALGSTNFQQGNYQESVANYLTGLKLKPNDPEGLFDLGNTYYVSGKLLEAVNQFSKAVTEDKKFWPAINNIGLIKYEQGNVSEAIAQWESAIKLEKQAAEPLLALGVALYTHGNQQRGIAMGEAALKIDERYGDLNFLKENLWGEHLLADTKKFLELPALKHRLQQSEENSTSNLPSIR